MPSSANTSSTAPPVSPREAFAVWAKIYDDLPNPLLSLEQRILNQLLPEVRGLDVVEIGCGTGRWLELIASQSPSSLVGIDSSPEMIERARSKMRQRATILLGDATSLPLQNLSMDVILAPFVASYISDLHEFAAESRRVARSGASVYVSDLHPKTVAACNWSRAFSVATRRIEVPTYPRSVQEVISCFEVVGFEVTRLIEPPFGPPEEVMFERAGKIAAFHAAVGHPAIYILELRAAPHPSRLSGPRGHARSGLALTGARVAMGPTEATAAEIYIEAGQIASITNPGDGRSTRDISPRAALDLPGYLIVPGLINSHDHLEFGLFPNLGHGPYSNSEEWANDIQRQERVEIERQQRIPKDVRLWWGAIRNLLCGVTTVCHHNPLTPEMVGDDFPIRVLSRLGWVHSLAMDNDIPAKFQATPTNMPFILHAAEGLDAKSANEVFDLDRMRVLDDRTVLVHGLALTTEGISLLNRRGAALVWCPTSNHFLFGRTHTREFLSRLTNVVLGSDSPLTAAGGLLDEVRFAHFEVGVDPDALYQMLISRPPRIFRLQQAQGPLVPGAAADLIAVRDTGLSPAKTVAEMSWEDVELVLVAGRVQLASQTMMDRLPDRVTSGLSLLEVDGHVRWIRAPLGRLFGEAARVLGCDLKIGKKRVRHVCTAWM
jgi:cytosine/adenosine deaminase-related metal-dependent hydrolase/ubiquinone/menaquinone biosynthesis C-methylase UbiE